MIDDEQNKAFEEWRNNKLGLHLGYDAKIFHETFYGEDLLKAAWLAALECASKARVPEDSDIIHASTDFVGPEICNRKDVSLGFRSGVRWAIDEFLRLNPGLDSKDT